MFYLIESSKSFYEVTLELEPVIQRLGFVVLHRHDMGEALRQRDMEFDEECCTYAVCNYRHAEKALNADMRLSLLIPWRIAVFTENGSTRVGLLRPDVASAQTAAPGLNSVWQEVQEKLIMVLDEMR